jgi:hypothetical protein
MFIPCDNCVEIKKIDVDKLTFNEVQRQILRFGKAHVILESIYRMYPALLLNFARQKMKERKEQIKSEQKLYEFEKNKK